MSHTVFQTAQIMPVNTHLVPTTKPLSSAPINPLLPVSDHHRVLPLCQKVLVVRNSSAIVDGDAVAGLERCFRMTPSECPAASSSAPPSHGPVMKGGQYGAFGAVTLEKSKLDMTQKQTKSSPENLAGILMTLGKIYAENLQNLAGRPLTFIKFNDFSLVFTFHKDGLIWIIDYIRHLTFIISKRSHICF